MVRAFDWELFKGASFRELVLRLIHAEKCKSTSELPDWALMIPDYARVDESAVRNTQDVDVLLRRTDLDAAEKLWRKLDLSEGMMPASIFFWMVQQPRCGRRFTS